MRKSLNTKLANKEKSALSTEKLERNEFYAVVNRQRLKIQYISRRNTDYIAIVVAIAQRIHLYSSRTQKLSSAAPKVLDGQLSGRIGRRHIIFLVSSAVGQPYRFPPKRQQQGQALAEDTKRKFVSLNFPKLFLDSSAAEHPAVTRRVVGSNPTRGAKKMTSH